MSVANPLFDYCIYPFKATLKNLIHCLEKAEEHAKEKGENVEDYCNLRLYEDMRNFTSQIQMTSDTAKNALARLAGQDTAQYSIADDEKTFAELKARLHKTLEFLNAADASNYIGKENDDVPLAGGRVVMPAAQAVQTYFLPNFYFHVSTAYGLLRMKGVPLGKIDLLLGKGGYDNVKKPEGTS